MDNYYQNQRIAESVKKYNKLPPDVREKLEKENPRREVTQQENLYSSPFTEIAKSAAEFAKKWNKNLSDVHLYHSAYDDYGSPSSEMHFEVSGLETDEQYLARLMGHYEATKLREEYDRREFERLKAKFK
jgi:hypothetical protein